jgi:hypothetical protein
VLNRENKRINIYLQNREVVQMEIRIAASFIRSELVGGLEGSHWSAGNFLRLDVVRDLA